jgi:hypothetical protein
MHEEEEEEVVVGFSKWVHFLRNKPVFLVD